MDYNRARLLLGMSGVGTWVVLCCVLLVIRPGAGELLLLYLSISLPFDLLGGQILPRVFGQAVTPAGQWLKLYLRALLLHTTLLVTIGAGLLLAGQVGLERSVGIIGLAVLVAAQPYLTRICGLRPAGTSEGAVIVDCPETGSTGGVVGWPGRETLLIPKFWSEEVRQVARRRRLLVVEKGARVLGLLTAVLWNGSGLWLATMGAVTTSHELARVALLSTLWSFLGLLLLPSVARLGVFWADKQTAKVVGRSNFLNYLNEVPDETRQARPFSEPIFYPIPSYHRRLSNLDSGPDRLPRPWYPARMALYLSIGCLGMLSRAVHCNSGRPSLWFLPPCD